MHKSRLAGRARRPGPVCIGRTWAVATVQDPRLLIRDGRIGFWCGDRFGSSGHNVFGPKPAAATDACSDPVAINSAHNDGGTPGAKVRWVCFSMEFIIMRALCWHGKGDVRVDTVPDPKIQHPRDAIIKI